MQLLVHMQYVLSHPKPSEFLNAQAAAVLKKSPKVFYQIIEDCDVSLDRLLGKSLLSMQEIVRSWMHVLIIQITAGLDVNEKEPMVKKPKPERTCTIAQDTSEIDPYAAVIIPNRKQNFKKISYDDYYEEWKSLATAKKSIFLPLPKGGIHELPAKDVTTRLGKNGTNVRKPAYLTGIETTREAIAKSVETVIASQPERRKNMQVGPNSFSLPPLTTPDNKKQHVV